MSELLLVNPDAQHCARERCQCGGGRGEPLIVKESGCNANTKTVSTPREKLRDKLVLDGRKIPILQKKRFNATQICMHETFLCGPRQIRPCRNSEAFGPENE